MIWNGTDYVGRRCPYCNREMAPEGRTRPTKDHVLPRHARRADPRLQRPNALSIGVQGVPPIVIVCWACNHSKGGLRLAQWLLKLEERGDFRAVHVKRFLDERERKRAAAITRQLPLGPIKEV